MLPSICVFLPVAISYEKTWPPFRYRNHLSSGEYPIVLDNPGSMSVRSPVLRLTR